MVEIIHCDSLVPGKLMLATGVQVVEDELDISVHVDSV